MGRHPARDPRGPRDDVEDLGTDGADAKKKTLHATEQDRPDVVDARQSWAVEQSRLSAHRWVFLDETWASTAMTPARGRSPRGRRCPGKAPGGHWKTTTFLCALRTTGLIAPLVLDG